MALPLLAPLVWLLPLIKIILLGSVKFIVVGIGAAFAPVTTANFLVSMSSGTPLKYAKFRYAKGDFSKEQLTVVEQANLLIANSIDNEDEHLTPGDARQFLKEVLIGTLVGIKEPIVAIPGSIKQLLGKIKEFVARR